MTYIENKKKSYLSLKKGTFCFLYFLEVKLTFFEVSMLNTFIGRHFEMSKRNGFIIFLNWVFWPIIKFCIIFCSNDMKYKMAAKQTTNHFRVYVLWTFLFIFTSRICPESVSVSSCETQYKPRNKLQKNNISAFIGWNYCLIF